MDIVSLLMGMTIGGGGGGLEYESGSWTPASDIAHGEISFTKEHTEVPSLYVVLDVSDATTLTDSSAVSCSHIDMYKLMGKGIPYGNSGQYYRYAQEVYAYIANSASTAAGGQNMAGKNSDDPGDSSDNYTRFWATEEKIRPYCGSASRYWRAGRTYKWIAVWKPAS